MPRIFITGSSDGLGSLAARALVKRGHSVVLHARNAQRAKDAIKACPGAETVLVADLSSFDETKRLAEDLNRLGAFDCVVFNAGMYRGPFTSGPAKMVGIPNYVPGVDFIVEGYMSIDPNQVAVNTFSAYILTCLIKPTPTRLVYVSSSMHHTGDASLQDLTWQTRGERGWSESQAYSDTKLHNILLANAVARKWPNVKSNSLDPGWCATKMGGASATGDMDAAVETYVMLAEGKGGGDESGKYFFSSKERASKTESRDKGVQERFLKAAEEVTLVKFPL
jgi:NAD(P)-dependent dehydrogenase (short-subunit alcohol dehydrogenase family)